MCLQPTSIDEPPEAQPPGAVPPPASPLGEPDAVTEIEDRQRATLGLIQGKTLSSTSRQEALMQHRSWPHTVHADAWQRAGEEARGQEGFADTGIHVSTDTLESEPTVTADGAWWHSVGVTATNLCIADTPLSIEEIFGVVRDTLDVQGAASAAGREVFRCA